MLRRRAAAPPEDRYGHLNPAKLEVLALCARELGCRSFADLGGIWAVDGGYARYAADVLGAERVVLVDDDLTPAYVEAAAGLPALEEVEANFGAAATPDLVGDVEVCAFFDVLLHQVAPDWDEVLGLWAARCTRAMAIVQPQWTGDDVTRLLELGEQEYLARVPSGDVGADSVYHGLWDRLDEVNPRRGRPWRDVHDIWQWGITDRALVARMGELGFGLRHFATTGPWQGHTWFHEGVFVFDRQVPVGPGRL